MARIHQFKTDIERLGDNDYLGADSVTRSGKISAGNVALSVSDRFAADPYGHGVPMLEPSNGLIPAKYLPFASARLVGNYDAAANSPALADGTGTDGDYYNVIAAGDNTPRSQAAELGDTIVYSGKLSKWYVRPSAVNLINGAATAAAARSILGVPSKLDLPVNVVDYGADKTGIGDSTAAFEAAAAVRGNIYVPEGRYVFSATPSLPNQLAMRADGSGSTLLDFSAASISALTNGNCIEWGTATWATLPDPVADIEAGQTSIEFASSPGVAIGDCIWIGSSRIWNPYRDYYLAGEYLVVSSVSGNVVSFETATIEGYTVAELDIRKKITFATGVIRGISIRGPASDSEQSTALSISFGRNITLDDVVIDRASRQGLFVYRCYGVRMSGIRARDDHSSDFGLDYGLNLNGCQNWTLTDSDFSAARHGLTITESGGATEPGSVPCQDGMISNVRTSSSGLTRGFNFHGGARRVIVSNCGIHGSADVGGNEIRFNNCQFYPRPGNDEPMLYLKEPAGLDFEFSHCDFGRNGIYTGRGAIFDFAGNEALFDENTYIPNGTLRFNHCKATIQLTADAPEDLCKIYRRGSTAAGYRISFTDNEFRVVGGYAAYALSVQHASGAQFDDIEWERNVCIGCAGLRVRDTAGAEEPIARRVRVSGGRIQDCQLEIEPLRLEDVSEYVSIGDGFSIIDCRIKSLVSGNSVKHIEHVDIHGARLLDPFWDEQQTALSAWLRFEYVDFLVIDGNIDRNRNLKIVIPSTAGWTAGDVINSITNPGSTATVYHVHDSTALFVRKSPVGTFENGDTIENATTLAQTTITDFRGVARYNYSFGPEVGTVYLPPTNLATNRPYNSAVRLKVGTPALLIEDFET